MLKLKLPSHIALWVLSSFFAWGAAAQVFEFSGEELQTQKKKSIYGDLELTLASQQGTTTEVGAPRIPLLRKVVEVSGPNPTLLNLQVNWKTDVILQERISPVIAPQLKLPGVTAMRILDENRYSADKEFPQAMARIADVGSVRGKWFATVEIAPLQYNPFKKRLLEASWIRFEIPEVRHSPSSELQLPKKLLILAGIGFEDDAHLKEYAKWKSSTGFKVTLKNLRDFASRAPEMIRSSIKTEYEADHFGYVLLIGDSEQLPTGKATAGFFVSDHSFSVLDRPTYEEDLQYPDVALGRLPAKTPEELASMLAKTMRYGKAEFETREWMKRISFVATDDRYLIAEGTHQYAMETHTKRSGYAGNFPLSPNEGGDALYAITHNAKTEDLLKAFQEGRAIIDYSGHGSDQRWVGPSFSQDNIRALSHTDALPYVISNACLTASFDGTSDSFGETWIKHPNGAIGFWGATTFTYWDEDDILEKRWFDALLGPGGTRNTAEANLAGLAGVRTQYSGTGMSAYYYEAYHLFGDPTVELVQPTK